MRLADGDICVEGPGAVMARKSGGPGVAPIRSSLHRFVSRGFGRAPRPAFHKSNGACGRSCPPVAACATGAIGGVVAQASATISAAKGFWHRHRSPSADARVTTFCGHHCYAFVKLIAFLSS